MSLDLAEVQQSLIVLGLSVRTDATFGYFGQAKKLRNAEICRKALINLNPEQIAKVREILAQYAPVEYDTDTIKAEGLDSNPGRLRVVCRQKMADTIGYAPSDSCDTIMISRG